MLKNVILFYVSIFVLITVGCARKQKNIYDFSKKERVKINKLSLPSVKAFEATKNGQTIFLSWNKIEKETSCLQLIGYDIFKFSESAFIPRKPVNRELVTGTTYLDRDVLGKKYYFVRAAFKFKDKIFYGPTSQILCID